MCALWSNLEHGILVGQEVTHKIKNTCGQNVCPYKTMTSYGLPQIKHYDLDGFAPLQTNTI